MLLWILLLALFLPASVAADAGGEVPACEEELPLSRAAAALLLRGEPPTSQTLMAAVREAGSDVVGVRAYLWRAPDDHARDWLARFEREADARVVCGRAQSESSGMLLVAARAGSLDLVSMGAPRVRGSLAVGFRDPELVVADGDGELQRIAIDRAGLARGIEISPELALPARVQLLARGRLGPRPIAERVLPAFDGGPATTGGDPSAADSATDFEAAVSVAQRLLSLRSRSGRPSLRENALLAGVATAHAQRVCAQGLVAHELVPGSDPKQRLTAAGVTARRVGETVARAESSGAAFAAFEHSPSHRLTLLEAGFTDVGIGEAKDAQHRVCVVVLLAAWPRYVGR